MRWTEPTLEVGDERTVRRFLWLPKLIRGEHRWLEVATWTEIACEPTTQELMDGMTGMQWRPLHWED